MQDVTSGSEPRLAAALELRAVSKRYKGHTAVDSLDLVVADGEFLALVGPSGCGKTTTLRIIAGLILPDEGIVNIRGRNRTYASPHRRDTTLVFQSYALFPHRTVAENVEYGLKRRGVRRPERVQRVREALELVNLPDIGTRYPRQLSGGQQQRVALARALVVRPSLLLLDEPLSNLDAGLRDQMRGELRRIHRETGTTTVLVTHDQDEALSVASRVAVMNQGRIEQLSEPRELYTNPMSPFVASFVGKTNLIPTEASDSGGVLSIRPEQITLVPTDRAYQLPDSWQTQSGVITEVLYTGPRSIVTVEVPELRTTLTVSVRESGRGDAEHSVGMPVTVGWSRELPLRIGGE